MKVREPETKWVRLDTLKPGEVFQTTVIGKEFFIVVVEAQMKDIRQIVSLSSGELFEFAADKRVRPIPDAVLYPYGPPVEAMCYISVRERRTYHV